MKKTLILSANAVPNVGGQGMNLHHVLEALKETFDVRLFCRHEFPGVNTEVVPQAGLANFVGRVPILRRMRDLQNLYSDRQFDGYVSRRITKADVFQGVGGQCLESLAAARKLGCRTAVDCITTHIEDFAEHQVAECAKFGIRPATNRRSRDAQREEYCRADVVRVLSEHAKQTFADRGFPAERVIVARPPIDVEQFPQAEFREPKFRISFVGLLEPWKGFHYLITAFHALKVPESELVFWGGSGTRAVSSYLREQMSRNPAINLRPVSVRQLGYGEVYGKSSVLVHPSLADGFGYVVAEAMASGLPVIVTRNTGSADLIVDGKNGYVVPPRDPEAIRERLAHLAAHPALLREMGAAARHTMQSRTSSELEEVYAPFLEKLASG